MNPVDYVKANEIVAKKFGFALAESVFGDMRSTVGMSYSDADEARMAIRDAGYMVLMHRPPGASEWYVYISLRWENS